MKSCFIQLYLTIFFHRVAPNTIHAAFDKVSQYLLQTEALADIDPFCILHSLTYYLFHLFYTGYYSMEFGVEFNNILLIVGSSLLWFQACSCSCQPKDICL